MREIDLLTTFSLSRPRTLLVNTLIIPVLALASFAVVLRVGLVPSHPERGVAVIYAPWTSANQAMIQAVDAGARFVRFGGFSFVAIVMPERPDYVERVLAGSALLAIDPQVLAACLPAALLKKDAR